MDTTNVAMDTVVNKWKSMIGGVEILDSSNLARKMLTANELIFAEYCEIHACWKLEMKVRLSEVIPGSKLELRPPHRPGILTG